MFGNLKDFVHHESEEDRLLARWRGEASRVWWNSKGTTDEVREKISKMDAATIFSLGWQCCRSYDITKNKVNNDDPDGSEDVSGIEA